MLIMCDAGNCAYGRHWSDPGNGGDPVDIGPCPDAGKKDE